MAIGLLTATVEGGQCERLFCNIFWEWNFPQTAKVTIKNFWSWCRCLYPTSSWIVHRTRLCSSRLVNLWIGLCKISLSSVWSHKWVDFIFCHVGRSAHKVLFTRTQSGISKCPFSVFTEAGEQRRVGLKALSWMCGWMRNTVVTLCQWELVSPQMILNNGFYFPSF